MSGCAADGLRTMEAIGLLRSGATPEATWWEAFGVGVDSEGAPEVGGLDPAETEALRAAGRLACRSGAPLADVLERIEEAERGRRRAGSAREVALAGPRASARVLLGLPVVGWVFAVVLDPGVVGILVATPLGWILLALGGALWAGGRSWLRRLVARAEAAGSEAAPAALVLALVEAAVASGLDIRTAIAEVGRAMGAEGEALSSVADRLTQGEGWSAAWGEAGGRLWPLERALRSSWFRGASPAPTLRAAREAIVEKGREEAEREAARLGVGATLPLALCLLPSFVVVGVIPLVVAMASGISSEW